MKQKKLIIVMFIALVLFFVWVGGFFLFCRVAFMSVRQNVEKTAKETVAFVNYENPDSLSHTGIAVLTGGRNRIAKAVELLNEGYGERMLISGVRRGTSLGIITSREDIKLDSDNPIELGYLATDTVGNAGEISRWAKQHRFGSIYVVTSFYHIPRSRLELEHKLPDMTMYFVAADTPYIAREWWKNFHSFSFLAAEYTKFLLVYMQYKMLGL